jgi:hypothetical protein
MKNRLRGKIPIIPLFIILNTTTQAQRICWILEYVILWVSNKKKISRKADSAKIGNNQNYFSLFNMDSLVGMTQHFYKVPLLRAPVFIRNSSFQRFFLPHGYGI